MASLDVRFGFVSLGCDSSLALPSSPASFSASAETVPVSVTALVNSRQPSRTP
jgi:hypothetical protein